MVSDQSIVGKVGKFNVCFRGVTLSSHAGLALLDDFAKQLGVAQILDEELHVKQRERGYRESEAVLSLSHNLISGGSCLLDLDVLRGDIGTRQLLGQARLMAPTTAGEFLRKFDLGDIHDLYRVHRRLHARVRPAQLAACCTLDVDSSVYVQASAHKQGSVKAYNGEIGYHPFFVFWAEERAFQFGGEVVDNHRIPSGGAPCPQHAPKSARNCWLKPSRRSMNCSIGRIRRRVRT
jgi:hypothetical protein